MINEDMQEVEGDHREENKNESQWFWCLFFVAVISIVCGIYGPSWLQETWVEQWLGNSFGVVCYMILCALCASCIMWSAGKYRWSVLILICSPLLYGLLTAAYLLDFRWEVVIPVGVCLIAGVSVLSILMPLRSAPFRKPGDDYLGRRLLYISTGAEIRRLLKENRGGGVSLLVSGPWGIGKSHFINFLVYTLLPQAKKWLNSSLFVKNPAPEDDIEFVAASVDVWKSATKEAMWQDVAEALTSAISGKSPEGSNMWRKNLFELMRLVNIPAVSFAEEMLQMVISGAGGDVSYEASISRRIRNSDKYYILILDNLDRCNKDKLDALFPLIERLKRIYGLVTICGFSIEETLKANPQTEIQGTLLKVFDISVTIPRPDDKYLLAYMAHLAEKIGGNDCPRFTAWMHRQELKFSTPREIETVVRSMCYLERNYLRFVPMPNDFDARVLPPRTDVIFYMEVLRRLYPDWAMKLEESLNYEKLLDSWNEMLRDAGEKDNSNNSSDNKRMSSPSDAEKSQICSCPLLGMLIRILNQCPSAFLIEAIEQKYLHIRTAEDEMCQQVLNLFGAGQHNSPLETIRAFFGPAINNELEEVPIYADILAYAYKMMQENDISYIKACIDMHIKQDNSPYAEMYLKSSELILRMLNVRYVKCLEGDAMSPWLPVASPMELNFTLHAWCSAIRLLGAHCEDAYEETDSSHARELFESLRMMAGAKLRIEFDNEARGIYDRMQMKCTPVLSFALESYAERICEAILCERFNAVDACVALDSFPGEACSWLKKGVERYVARCAHKWDNKAEVAEIMVPSLYAFDTRTPSEDDDSRPVLLLALSFVAVWTGLHRALFPHGSELPKKHKLALEDYLKKMNKDPLSQKDDKNYNREKAKTMMKEHLKTWNLKV